MASSEIKSIYSFLPHELEELLLSFGASAGQITHFLSCYFGQRRVVLTDFPKMSQKLRLRCAEELDFQLPQLKSRIDSKDGTSKLLLLSQSNKLIESVLMRYENRTVLCLSSQVGCKLACTFCQTGKLGFMSNLSTAEIIQQFCLANDLVRPEGRKITNIVFMGMGEPLDNFTAVVKAVKILNTAFGLSKRRITVSTAGLPQKIKALAHEVATPLAISLHACRDDLRSQLMPINKAFALAELKEALRYYQDTTQTKLTVEYLLIKNINSSLEEAKELAEFVKDLQVKINLIPFNHHPGMPYEKPNSEEIWSFQKYLLDRKLLATVRYSRGDEVSAACGQLARKEVQNLNSVPEKARCH